MLAEHPPGFLAGFGEVPYLVSILHFMALSNSLRSVGFFYKLINFQHLNEVRV